MHDLNARDIHEHDEASILNALGVRAVPNDLRDVYCQLRKLYHRAGGTGALGPLVCAQLCQQMNYLAPGEKQPHARVAPDWREVPEGTQVAVNRGGEWRICKFVSIVDRGMLLLELAEPRDHEKNPGDKWAPVRIQESKLACRITDPNWEPRGPAPSPEPEKPIPAQLPKGVKAFDHIKRGHPLTVRRDNDHTRYRCEFRMIEGNVVTFYDLDTRETYKADWQRVQIKDKEPRVPIEDSEDILKQAAKAEKAHQKSLKGEPEIDKELAAI